MLRSSATIRHRSRLAVSASRRGQALIIAVLVLFAVATLAALFVAIISSQLAQVARHSDLVQLRNIAEAGLRLANEQLTFSMYGADWRPSPNAYKCGEGEVTILVSYEPLPDRVQSRFLRIDASAVLRDNPFLRHTIVALKPLLLADYARLITDRYETDKPARMGVTGVELGGDARVVDLGEGRWTEEYVYRIDGPIRSNADLVWHGQSRVALHTAVDAAYWSDQGLLRDDLIRFGLMRDDRIEVAGEMRPGPGLGQEAAFLLSVDGLAWPFGEPTPRDLFSPVTYRHGLEYEAGFPSPWEWQAPSIPGGDIPAVPANTRAVLADLPPRFAEYGEVRSWLSVPRVRAPDIDATHPDLETHRYLMLTRDAGEWRRSETEGIWYSSGEFGWGWTNFAGIYIDNTADIQYGHDLDMLRLNWTRSVGEHLEGQGDERPDPEGAKAPPRGPADWWDAMGRHYAPPGVEIILHGDMPCPEIEIIRHDDPDGNGLYWRDPDGQETDRYLYAPSIGMCAPQGPRPVGIIDARSLRVPFPPNGVIYAAGNVRIRGSMPPVRDNQGRRGPEIGPEDAPEAYFGDWLAGAGRGRTRRFDLQVVSGGTIYVEGDVLTPRAAGLIPDSTRADILYGSRLALLARDYVCLNTTALNPRPQDLYQLVPDASSDPPAEHYYNDAQPTLPRGSYADYWWSRGPVMTDQDAIYQYGDPAEPVSIPTEPGQTNLIYDNARLQQPSLRALISDLRIMVGHSGAYSVANPEGEWAGLPAEPPDPEGITPDEPAVDVGITVGGEPLGWEGGNEYYRFVRPGLPPDTAGDQSGHWSADLDLTDPVGDDWLELLPSADQSMSGIHNPAAAAAPPLVTGSGDIISLSSFVSPVREVELINGEPTVTGWQVPPQDLAYMLGPVAIAPANRTGGGQPVDPLPVEVHALIYAQNGSWFVIPGAWFNEDPDEFTGSPPASRHPGYHEPLNIRIAVYGAVSENMPADLGSAAEWTSKWGGPYGTGDRGFLSYTFDPLLRMPRRETADRIGHVRFPNFPVTSDLVVWGERMTGPLGG